MDGLVDRVRPGIRIPSPSDSRAVKHDCARRIPAGRADRRVIETRITPTRMTEAWVTPTRIYISLFHQDKLVAIKKESK